MSGWRTKHLRNTGKGPRSPAREPFRAAKITPVHTYLGCYPCFARQALTAAQRSGADEATAHEVVVQALSILQRQAPGATPPVIARAVAELVRTRTGRADPYRDAKDVGIRGALAMLPYLREGIAAAEDPLVTALRLAAAGAAAGGDGPEAVGGLSATVARALAGPLVVDHVRALREALGDADHVLYLASSAAGAVVDRLLIEALGVPVTYAVKSAPVLEEATRADAEAAGIAECATVVETGSDAPGTLLTSCSPAFRRVYRAAPVVVAPGQASYETLSDAGPRVFAVLLVTCPVIGRDLDVPVGGVVVRQATGRDRRRSTQTATPHGRPRTAVAAAGGRRG